LPAQLALPEGVGVDVVADWVGVSVGLALELDGVAGVLAVGVADGVTLTVTVLVGVVLLGVAVFEVPEVWPPVACPGAVPNREVPDSALPPTVAEIGLPLRSSSPVTAPMAITKSADAARAICLGRQLGLRLTSNRCSTASSRAVRRRRCLVLADRVCIHGTADDADHAADCRADHGAGDAEVGGCDRCADGGQHARDDLGRR